jgi:hypothetical protein
VLNYGFLTSDAGLDGEPGVGSVGVGGVETFVSLLAGIVLGRDLVSVPNF